MALLHWGDTDVLTYEICAGVGMGDLGEQARELVEQALRGHLVSREKANELYWQSVEIEARLTQNRAISSSVL
jgi:hypothetical protein